MSQLPCVYLDRRGDAIAPEGCVLVETEREFLARALDPEPLLIRGESICRWAEVFYAGRNRPYQVLRAPAERLRLMIPGLDEAAALRICEVLGDRTAKLEEFTPREVLTQLFPAGPWDAEPSIEHAASWLLFLDRHSTSEDLAPVLQAQARTWEAAASVEAQPAYQVSSAGGASEALEAWLGLVDTPGRVSGRFPLPVPAEWLGRARQRWAPEIVQRGVELYKELRTQELPPELLKIAAEETAKYLQHHPGTLSHRLVSLLQPCLAPEMVRRLNSLCPPAEPGSVPSAVEEVTRWYREEYGPYRAWQAENGSAEEATRVQALARAFAEWYLPYCRDAFNGSGGREQFAFSRAEELRARREQFVTLWVILDGLNPRDAEALTAYLLQDEPRLTVLRSDLVLAPVPTITRVCKPTLFSGKPPAAVSEAEPVPDFPGVRRLRDTMNWAKELAEAQLGDILVWSHLEPDKTYHSQHDPELIRANAQGELRKVVDRVRRVVQAVDGRLRLRVCITTDHGRLLSSGVRSHEVPAGMTSHGRAAWGDAPVAFGSSGIHIDEEKQIAYLSRYRFSLAVDCAVVLDGDVFRMSDGRTGTEHYPHGGVYPEEVLIPWIELERDAAPASLRCRLSGSGEAGKTAGLELVVDNAGMMEMHIEAIRLTFTGGRTAEIPMTLVAAPYSSVSTRATLAPWPDETELGGATAQLLASGPVGSPSWFSVELALEAKQMYKQSLTLDDF